jgi:D-alanine-D-alanine ligase
MTATSLVPELAAHAGLSFGELVQWMVEDASFER